MSLTDEFQRSAGANSERLVQEMFAATATGDIAAVKALAAKGVPVDCRNDNGDTPLLFAAQAGNVSLAEALLDLKADPNAENHEGYSIIWSALCGRNNGNNREMADLLMKNGTQPFDIKPPHRKEVLHCALQFGSETVVEAAMEARTMVDAFVGEKGERLIHVAARGGHAPIVKRLIAAGANINATDNDKHSVLRAAMESGDTETVMTILDAGADTHNKSLDQKSGRTITDESFAVDCNFEIATAAAEASKKFTLIEKAKEGDVTSVHTLLEEGVTPNAVDRSGKTALFYASEHNSAEIVADLIRHRADVNKRVWAGDLPITAACWNNAADVIPLLCKAGASVFDKNGIGEPAVKILDSDSDITGLTGETRAVILKFRNDEIRKVTREAAHAAVPVKTVGKFRLKTNAIA